MVSNIFTRNVLRDKMHVVRDARWVELVSCGAVFLTCSAKSENLGGVFFVLMLFLMLSQLTALASHVHSLWPNVISEHTCDDYILHVPKGALNIYTTHTLRMLPHSYMREEGERRSRQAW